MFLKIGVKKLGFESGKGFDFLKSENAMRAAVQECGMVFLQNVRGVQSQDIFQSHINIDLII
jgi:formate-dependent phosphoribosylglycinamide formyltransferase (GAR transformylase)